MIIKVFETTDQKREGLQHKVAAPNTIYLFKDISQGTLIHTNNCLSILDIYCLDKNNKIIKKWVAHPNKFIRPVPSNTKNFVETLHGLLTVREGDTFDI